MAMNLHKGDNVNRLHSKVIDTIPYIFKTQLLNNARNVGLIKRNNYENNIYCP